MTIPNRWDPDPLYVEEERRDWSTRPTRPCPGRDEYGFSHPRWHRRVRDRETQDERPGIGWLVIIAAVVGLAILAAALLLATPRSASGSASTALVHSGAPLVTLVVPSATMPASPAADGVGVREDDDAPQTAIGEPLTGMRGDLPDTATSVRGTASWYCGAGSRCTRGFPASGLYAAAGPALRVGDWRGRIVTVRSGTRTVRVRLIDWCFCGGGRVVDLYRSAFSKLASPSRGSIRVSVTWDDDGPLQTVPPTDSEVQP